MIYMKTLKLFPVLVFAFAMTILRLNAQSIVEEKVAGSGVTDVDGNIYTSVIIGDQEWMVENLKTTKYYNGKAIRLALKWDKTSKPFYCWHNNDTTYKNPYGALYNWYVVNTGKLCPIGWHVPSDSEWTVLENYLGGDSIAGGKLKEKDTFHWQRPDTISPPNWRSPPDPGATNISGFSALPGGCRGSDGTFMHEIGQAGYWWSSTEIDTHSTYAWVRGIDYYDNKMNRFSVSTFNGFSVRCVRD
jgi:uncharacterized protein (TIGR02145 family)